MTWRLPVLDPGISIPSGCWSSTIKQILLHLQLLELALAMNVFVGRSAQNIKLQQVRHIIVGLSSCSPQGPHQGTLDQLVGKEATLCRCFSAMCNEWLA